MDTKEEFLPAFLRIERESSRTKDTSYGANVMPFLNLYDGLPLVQTFLIAPDVLRPKWRQQ
jgi:hypothetical protein